ncbi:MAG: 1,4-alpha-glucan branching protein GlgB [Lachnospiraceae bacterium]|nr:1,4-alpha-glucan branching protein GlgB [Lachnospiraceae bacterium]
MTKKLYNLMDWAGIEAIVYAEEDQPQKLLGIHDYPGARVAQMFYPGAVEAVLHTKTKDFKMELVDDAGYFAVLVPKSLAVKDYSYTVTLESGKTEDFYDPYEYGEVIDIKELRKFNKGINYDIYHELGAHPYVIEGVRGVLFAVWAPNAMRVSVVGDFNRWDGRIHQMIRRGDTGVFELFIPKANVGDYYKFEIKAKGGASFLKSDPYGVYAQKRPDTASIVYDLNDFTWKDDAWIVNRRSTDTHTSPVSVYELHLGSFAKPLDEEKEFYTYRELAPKVVDYVKKMGYTHVELMPVMEHPFDASWGYQVIGYYAPTSRYGTPLDFKFFMNALHEAGIGVILDWVPAHFPRDAHGLATFDGTCLYEHADPRRGSHPEWGTLIYNYARPEVKNYLIANVLYWINEYHADGIRMDAVASMLYLDYGKKDGEWLPNMYGGKENLDAVEFLKHLNSVVKKADPSVLMIAEESTAWPDVTGPVKKDGLGFDYKWNMGWMNDFLDYMGTDPLFRAGRHGELTFSMIYAYSERFILSLSHDEVVHGKSSLIGKMPGEREEKFANLRAAYTYMMLHPGKKLLFMGQDLGEFDEWNEDRSVEWDLLEYDEHKRLNTLISELNAFYKAHPALWKLDEKPEGFEWINSISADENVLVFLRKTADMKDTLLVVCNFSGLDRKDYKIGVPALGKYKEIFNSDNKKFGGDGFVNAKAMISNNDECDDREESLRIKLPAFSVCVFSYTALTAKEKANVEKKREIERKRRIEEERKNSLLKEEQEAKRIAAEARRVAEDLDRQAKEALKRAMDASKYAQELDKKAREIEAKRIKSEEKEEKLRSEL